MIEDDVFVVLSLEGSVAAGDVLGHRAESGAKRRRRRGSGWRSWQCEEHLACDGFEDQA